MKYFIWHAKQPTPNHDQQQQTTIYNLFMSFLASEAEIMTCEYESSFCLFLFGRGAIRGDDDGEVFYAEFAIHC